MGHEGETIFHPSAHRSAAVAGELRLRCNNHRAASVVIEWQEMLDLIC